MTVGEFRKEAETMHKLRHPNLVSLLAISEESGKIYIITERMSRGALLTLLRDDTGSPINFKDLMHMAIQVRLWTYSTVRYTLRRGWFSNASKNSYTLYKSRVQLMVIKGKIFTSKLRLLDNLMLHKYWAWAENSHSEKEFWFVSSWLIVRCSFAILIR